MPNETAILPSELDRRRLDERTIQSTYQAGYSLITVKSIFGATETYQDLLFRIIQRKLNTTSTLS